jgi:hypothetical protein
MMGLAQRLSVAILLRFSSRTMPNAKGWGLLCVTRSPICPWVEVHEKVFYGLAAVQSSFPLLTAINDPGEAT